MSDLSDFNFLSVELAYIVSAVGKAVTVRKRVSGSYDPTTGKATVTETDYTTSGIFLGYKDYNVDGTLVLRGDRRVVLATGVNWTPSVYMPVAGDIIVAGSNSWNVVDTKELELQGSKIGYVVQVRGMKSG